MWGGVLGGGAWGEGLQQSPPLWAGVADLPGEEQSQEDGAESEQSLCPLARGPAEAEKREGSRPETVQGGSPETCRPRDWMESAAVLLMRTRESAGSAGAPRVPGSGASGGLASQTWVMTSVLKPGS